MHVHAAFSVECNSVCQEIHVRVQVLSGREQHTEIHGQVQVLTEYAHGADRRPRRETVGGCVRAGESGGRRHVPGDGEVGVGCVGTEQGTEPCEIGDHVLAAHGRPVNWSFVSPTEASRSHREEVERGCPKEEEEESDENTLKLMRHHQLQRVLVISFSPRQML